MVSGANFCLTKNYVWYNIYCGVRNYSANFFVSRLATTYDASALKGIIF